MHGNFEVIKLVIENGVCDVKIFPLLTTKPRFDVKANLTPKRGLGGEKKNKNDIIPHKRHLFEFVDILLEYM